MEIRDNNRGRDGSSSGGGSVSGENGGTWGGFIVDGYGSVGSIIASVVIYIVGFLFYLSHFFPVNVFSFIEASTSNVLSPKTKNKATVVTGGTTSTCN